MDTKLLTYQIAFASIRGMSYDLATKLIDVIGSEKNFFDLSEEKLRAITGGKSKVYSDAYRREQLIKAQHEVEFISKNNIRTVYFTHPDYPTRLRNTDSAPAMLYVCGDCDLNSKHMVSIVGTRHATAQGIRFCDKFVEEMAHALPDCVIVSGLAYGIDIAAHRAALKHHLPTVSVMARGLNKIYPDSHRKDAANIVHSHGALVTDYLSQDQLHRGNFLARNRIIAALSDCTVVVESAMAGGALVTANLAASYNRDVFAIPGRVNDEFSRGCNRLIQNNTAMLISCADDLIKAMNWESHRVATTATEHSLFPEFTEEESVVIDMLKKEGDLHINALADKTGIPVYRLMGTLVELDCKGFVTTLPGCRYTLA